MYFFQVALIALTALLCPISATLIDSSSCTAEELLRQEQWQHFKLEYKKAYATVEEDAARFQIFQENLVRAAELSLANPLATFGVTRFSDLTPAEFRHQYLGYRPNMGGAAASSSIRQPRKACAEEVSPNADIDWRTKGAVTPVKDQGICGSCWAFSAVETIESAAFLKSGTLPVLSEEQVVDCDPQSFGCGGGWPAWAYEYIESAGGLTTEALYPYTSGKSGVTGKCKSVLPAPAVKLSSFSYATPPCNDSCANQDEVTLLKSLSTAPVSICVNAINWALYTGGIINSTDICLSAYNYIDHCVQLVGYNGSGDTDYWIVRNSWATTWGIDGYVYLKYGQNMCGLADQATIPTVV